MDDQSGSIHFRALFESALQAYEAKTGITLPAHPLTLLLRSCDSIESITTFLQDQIRGSSDFQGNDKVINLVKSTTSILSTLSTTAAFDWAVGLVCPKALMTRFTSLTVLLQTFSPEDALHAGLAILFAVRAFFSYYMRILVTFLCIRRPMTQKPAAMRLSTCSSRPNIL